jgi:CRP-like cAMP-binding protein
MYINQAQIAEPHDRRVSLMASRKWEDYNGHSPLSAFFNAIYPLCQQARRCIDKHTFPLTIKRGEFLISPFSVNLNLYFITKGVIRGFMYEEDKEITTWINVENEIVGTIRNLGLQLASEEYLQALEDTTLIGIPKTLIGNLYERFPETNITGRILLERNYRDAEERAYICRIPSADKKYERYMETSPKLLNRIPLKYIASYLGITLETLSRVRGRYGMTGK